MFKGTFRTFNKQGATLFARNDVHVVEAAGSVAKLWSLE